VLRGLRPPTLSGRTPGFRDGQVYPGYPRAPALTAIMKARLKYTGIRVKDIEASINFYTKVLGMTARGRETIAETKGIVIDLVSGDGSHPLELNYYAEGSPFDLEYNRGEELDHLGFKVDDLDQAVAEAQKAGFPVIQEVKTATNRWVYLRDPNGIWIELSRD
jgi:catechol 2,3-dioxygenase-like lactoylglutathione lyase family enzyme